jgi:hypothetical protein
MSADRRFPAGAACTTVTAGLRPGRGVSSAAAGAAVASGPATRTVMWALPACAAPSTCA